jgi:hypothetical protein
MSGKKVRAILVVLLVVLIISACGGVDNTENAITNNNVNNNVDINNNTEQENPNNNNEMDSTNQDVGTGAQADAGGGGIAGDWIVTIVQGDALLAVLNGPALYVFTDSAAFDEISKWFDPEQRTAIAKADYSNNYVITAFYGVASTSGHSITVQEIYVDDETVKVIVVKAGVPEGQMAADVISYPFHVIAIPNRGLKAPEGAVWEMIDTDGNLLATFTP